MDKPSQELIEQLIKDSISKQDMAFNKTITEVEKYINDNEKAWVDTIQQKFKGQDTEWTTLTERWRSTLDHIIQDCNHKIKELEDAQPRIYSPEPQKLIIQFLKERELDKEITLNGQHRKFPDLMLDIQRGHHLYNYGPTGSGKTVAVYTAAKALDLKVYREVMNRETSPYNFSGYMKGGEYVPGSAFYPFTQGGILFVDEIDNGNANANTSIKKYSDADEVMFGNKLFTKHKDFRLVANANTIGNGANQQYVGRNQQDKALLNIFKFHHWDYDLDFEYSICWQEYIANGGPPESKARFDKFIQSLRDFRRAIEDLNILHIVSPRNLKQASKDYALGRDILHITECIILKGLDEGQTTKIIEKIRSYYPGSKTSSNLATLYSA